MTLGCGGLPAPPAYDHAMLRDYFGKSPADVEVFLGKPTKVERTSIDVTIENEENPGTATSETTMPSTAYIYSTPDGDLVFLFNGEDQVNEIIYAGIDVSPSKP